MEDILKLKSEFQASLDQVGEALKTKAHNAETKAAEAMVKAQELITKMESESKATKDELDALRKDFNEMAAKMTASTMKTKKADLAEEIKENKEAIQRIVKSRSGEIELKADTLTTSITDNETSFHLPNIGQLGVKLTSLYDVLPKVNVPAGMHNGTISYVDWDEATTVRAAAAVAEGAPFPESTAKFRYYKEELKKIGDILPVSEEFGEDAVSAAAELNRFLTVNVGQERSRQLAVGDGTNNTIRGLINRSTAYTPVAAGIVAPNLKDLVRKMRTTIVKGRGSKYNPDIVVMNSDTYDQYYLAKDGENNYLFDENGRIAGLTVIEDNFMPDNTLVVGDRRFATVYQMMGVVISEGYVGDQFGEDLKSLKARTRLAMLIREVDRTGFLYCSSISAALAILDNPVTT